MTIGIIGRYYCASVCTQPERDLLSVEAIERVYCASVFTQPQPEVDLLIVEAIVRVDCASRVLSTRSRFIDWREKKQQYYCASMCKHIDYRGIQAGILCKPM